jgi:hypothetical protein
MVWPINGVDFSKLLGYSLVMTDEEKARFNRIAELNKSIEGSGHNISAVSSLASEVHGIVGGDVIANLRAEISKYLKVTQQSAKDKTWHEIMRYVQKADIQVSWAKGRAENPTQPTP